MIHLGVNIDHVATIRQARRGAQPELAHAATLAVLGGADSITIHLREDRRHIQDRDLPLLLQMATVPVNLEMALLPTTRLGGHLVSGHVDGVGHILERVDDGRSWRFTVEAPKDLARYIAEKGSICINGISLTVNSVSGAQFTVNIVPHTLKETTLGTSGQGDAVNLEVDLIARYLERLLLGEKAGIPASGVTMALLQDNGFA